MKLYTWTLQHFAFYKQLILHLLSFNRTALMADIKTYVTNTSMLTFLLVKRVIHGYMLFKLRKDKRVTKEM